MHENNILLVKTTYGYDYGLPGGGIKKHESPVEAAIREVKEEVGIDIQEPQQLPSFITCEEYKEDTVYGFYTTVTSPYFKLDALEIDSAEWHPITKLPKLGTASGKIVNLYLSQYHKELNIH
jgi:8-oxo-dGTP pyrophosphatase MutT (NUDIX family)